MLYRAIMAVCSEIHIKHINTLCGQNVELLNVKLAVHIVTTRIDASGFFFVTVPGSIPDDVTEFLNDIFFPTVTWSCGRLSLY